MTFPALAAIGEQPQGRGAWVWLWDLEVERRTVTLPPVVLRITSAATPVQWPPRAALSISTTVSVLTVPARGRFTGSAGQFSTCVVGHLVDVAGSAGSLGAGGNNVTQATISVVAGDGSFIEIVGGYVAEGPLTLSFTLGPTPVTFYPFPFSMSEIEQSQDGDLPSLDLAIDNTARTLMVALHEAGGCVNNRATLTLTHSTQIASPAYPSQSALVFDFRITQASASDGTVQLRLESPSYFQQTLPTSRYIAKRCRWGFGSPDCGYIITQFAGFTTCGKTIDDCVARGLDEAARGLLVLHPKRFGGFPGIPTQRTG